MGDRERLLGYLEGTGRSILVEPQAMLTESPRMPGLDGRKMSKSYGNFIGLREDADSVDKKFRTMPTDPARVRRTDPGDPEKCPVWEFHKVYSDDETRDWVQTGCRSAGIGCIDCKKRLIDAVQAELDPIRERGRELEANPEMVRGVIADGCEKARSVARDTMEDVRQVMGLSYR
jgi:tryptophanyl-tRNA synthetase